MTEKALVRRDADFRPLYLPFARFARQLPRELAHLRNGLRGHRFAETRKTPARVDGNAATDRRHTLAQEPLCLAGVAETDVLVPIELERRRLKAPPVDIQLARDAFEALPPEVQELLRRANDGGKRSSQAGLIVAQSRGA